MVTAAGDLEQAYAAARRLARAHYENFPVASTLLPRAMRPHVAALYAFARTADDFADEGSFDPEQRLRWLDDWERRLRQAAGTSRRLPAADGGDVAGAGADPAWDSMFLALGNTIRTLKLPLSLFEDLLSAFRQDVTTSRYQVFDDLLDYSRRSANPVGRLVLRIAGRKDDTRLDEASDCLCTALQLTNFWQDLAIDWERGRLYVPLDDCRRTGALEADLDRRSMTPAWREVLDEMAGRTRDLFRRGRAVGDLVGGRLGLELRLTWLGGTRTLDRLEKAGFDVFNRRPSLGMRDVPSLLGGLIIWRAGAPVGQPPQATNGEKRPDSPRPGGEEPT